MIIFNKKDNSEQLISIFVCDGTNTRAVMEHIIKQFPAIAENIHGFDYEEIIIRIPKSGMSFSLNELRKEVNAICVNATQCFVVDISEDGEKYQRLYF